MEMPLSPFFAKCILRIIPYRFSHRLLVVCRGYNEDFENFTELGWQDDKYLNFADRESYPQFQLWLI